MIVALDDVRPGRLILVRVVLVGSANRLAAVAGGLTITARLELPDSGQTD